jgi:AcrR family transcriptional regulator
MPAVARRRGRPQDKELVTQRKEQILAAAAKVFARHGYPDTEVQAVADAIDVGKGTIYRYFPSKERLFLATVDRAMSKLREHVQTASASKTDPLDRVTAAIQAYLEYFQTHPEHAELLIIERAEYRDRKTPTYLAHCRANAESWETVYVGLIRDGRIRDIPVQRIMTVVSDLMYGTMFTNHFSGQERPFWEQARDVIDIVFHGLLTTAEKKRQRK